MKLKRNKKKLRAAKEAIEAVALTAIASMDNLSAEAKAAGKRPTFTMKAYTGGPMKVGFSRPVVIDVSGMRAGARVPILLDHDASQIVGQAKPQIANGEINIVDGVVTGDDDPATKVVSHARNGFEWMASVGVSIDKLESIDGQTTAMVNGKEVQGPAYIVRAGRLGEVSFVSIGADESASAKVAASRATEVSDMTFEQWLEANGWPEVAELTAAQKKTLEAAFKNESDAEADENEKPKVEAKEEKTTTDNKPVDLIAQATKDAEYITGVQAALKDHPELMVKAFKEKWSVEKAQYEGRFASMTANQAPSAIIKGNEKASVDVLTAAIRMQSAEPNERIEKEYKPEVLDAAYKHRRMGLKALIQASLAIEGKPCPTLNAGINDWVKAGFGTHTLPAVLSNSANKLLQASFMSVPMASRIVAKKLTANDFKTHTGMRLTGDTTFDKVGDGGELKHAALADTNYTFAVETYGKMIGLTRQQWINDDLGAFAEIPMKLGRGAGLAIESTFWAMVIANAGTFFGTGNNNYISGATTALGIEGLRLAITKMAKLKDADNLPINVMPKYLVVPPELEGIAREIFAATGLIATGVPTSGKDRDPATNIYSGRFQPVMTPYLTDSATAWYLLADPNDVACFGLAFLNGVDTPVVEEAPLSADVLGFQWRGYIDFGTCLIDKQGGIKSKGAA